MKERPILFKGEMVRAILDGCKTQTRRVMKPQPTSEGKRIYWNGAKAIVGKSVDCLVVKGSSIDLTELEIWDWCPYGRVGDRLWVRETFVQTPDGICYRATESECGILEPGDEPVWKPSIFMPRSASRLTLDVTNLRVERAQDISEEDAIAEGTGGLSGEFHQKSTGNFYSASELSAKQKFQILWDGINAKRGFGWDANPWVWVVEFKEVQP